MPVGSFSGSSGFSEFLHRLLRGNGGLGGAGCRGGGIAAMTPGVAPAAQETL